MSAASLWEIAIKRGLGRADFRVDALLRRGLLDNGYGERAGYRGSRHPCSPPMRAWPSTRRRCGRLNAGR
jgi:hypothetical protein